jgi:hypothetical protein
MIREKVEGALVVDLFDAAQLHQKIVDGPVLPLFSVRNCMLACRSFLQYAQWLFPGTLLQLVMRIGFLAARRRPRCSTKPTQHCSV